jgi:prepilin-type N-terminal cleavage/methylation domain-containing protein
VNSFFYKSRGFAGSLNRSSDRGVTLLECLMAITVIGLIAGLVLPPLFIATATRVQNRRAAQALQIAQGEVDRVRNLAALQQHTPTNLPASVNLSARQLRAASPPSQASSTVRTTNQSSGCSRDNGTPLPATTALMVDIDGDCSADFMMQVFRTPGFTSQVETTGLKRPSSFNLGVRVYSSLAGRVNATDALVAPGGSLTGLLTDPASLGLTAGQNNQLKRPLAVFYTTISWSEQDATLCSYHVAERSQDAQRSQIESCQNSF